MRHMLILLAIFLQFIFANDQYYYNNGIKHYLTPINQTVKIRSISNNSKQYFKTNNNIIVAVKDTILIKLKKSNISIDNILERYNISLIDKLTNKIYLLKIKNFQDIFDISNLLYNDKDIQYAHPNFEKKVHLR